MGVLLCLKYNMVENFIEVYKKYVPDELCDKLIAMLDKHSKEGMNSQGNHHFPNRKDFQLPLDYVELPGNVLSLALNSNLDKALLEYGKKFCEAIGNTNCTSYRIKLQKTLVGGGFHNWHSEVGENGFDVTRLLTWSVYLNDIPEGEGETEFLYFGKRIQPCKGDILIFPANFMYLHRGNPPITTIKYIATGWWHYAL